MFAAQLRDGIAAARNTRQLDDLARLLWRGLAEGLLAETDAEVASVALEARRSAMRLPTPATVRPPPRPRRRPVSPDRRASLERRRRVAASGALPALLAAQFTQGEVAVLSVVAQQVRRHGECRLPLDAVAAMAGVGRTTAQEALRQARRLGLVSVRERRRQGQPSLTNVVTIVCRQWSAWLKRGGRVQKAEHHVNQTLLPVERPRPSLTFSVRSWHNETSRFAGGHDEGNRHCGKG